MLKRSEVEREIIYRLAAKGGRCENAHHLIVDELGRAWWHGYQKLKDLERSGVITITRNCRGPSCPLIITLAAGHE